MRRQPHRLPPEFEMSGIRPFRSSTINTLEGKHEMPFTAKPITALPKRIPPSAKTVDMEAAKALYDLLATSENLPATMPDPADKKATVTLTAEDGIVYPDVKSARNEANKAKRLVEHVAPDTLVVKTRVYKLDDEGTSWAYAVWLAVDDPKKPDLEAAAAE